MKRRGKHSVEYFDLQAMRFGMDNGNLNVRNFFSSGILGTLILDTGTRVTH